MDMAYMHPVKSVYSLNQLLYSYICYYTTHMSIYGI